MPPRLRSSPFQKQQRNAIVSGHVWQPQESYIWPGRMGWTSAALAGWQTAVSGIPSTNQVPSVVATWWAYVRCIFTSIRQGILTLIPATMPFATLVSRNRKRHWAFFSHSVSILAVLFPPIFHVTFCSPPSLKTHTHRDVHFSSSQICICVSTSFQNTKPYKFSFIYKTTHII